MVKYDDQKETEAQYKVGYKKPPKHSQFSKGKSGNPNGRPKKRKSSNFMQLLQRSIDQKVKVRVGDRVKYMSKLEAGVEQITNKIASGDLHTIKMVLPLFDKVDYHRKWDCVEQEGDPAEETREQLRKVLGLDPHGQPSS